VLFRSTSTGAELWVFDGTTSTLLLDINTGTGSSFPKYMTSLNGGLLFQASSDGVNNKLYYYKNTILKTLN